jgi:hypothetical protein
MDPVKPHGLLGRRASCRGRYHALSLLIVATLAYPVWLVAIEPMKNPADTLLHIERIVCRI